MCREMEVSSGMSLNEPPERASPFERTYRGLLRALYEDTVVPGQRLAAPDLMKQFNVGRGTIREVLHRLASSGIVTIVPNRGAQVRLLSRADVDQLLDIVELLLGLAARGAASAVSDGESASLLQDRHSRLKQMCDINDFTGFVHAREEYYRYIVRMSGNQELQRLFPGAQVHIMRVQLRRFQNAADATALSDFAMLTDAIMSGDPQIAEAAGREHVGFTRTRLSRLPDSAFGNI